MPNSLLNPSSPQVRSITRLVAIMATTLVAFAFVVTYLYPTHTLAWTPNTNPGLIDASTWDFAADGRVSLAGVWMFEDLGDGINAPSRPAQRRPTNVPGAWPVRDPSGWAYRSNGSARYSVHLKLPAVPNNERIAMATGYWMSAYRILANGRLLVESGKVARDASGERANSYSRIVTLPEGVRDIDLVVEISNHMNRFGGVSVAPEIGLESELLGRTRLLEAMSAFLVGTMFFGALYHLTLFTLDRTVKPNLWFGLFAALLAVRTLAITPLAGDTVNVVDQYWVFRINYASTMLLLPAVYQFFQSSFPNQVRRDIAGWLWWTLGYLALLTMISNAVIGEICLKALQIVAIGVMGYLSVGLVRAYLQQVQGAALALSGWLLCAAASLHDILTANGLIPGGNLIPLGFLAFFLCLSGMLAARYREAFRQAQVMTLRLKSLNGELEDAVQKRTIELKAKLDELNRNQSELERAREAAVAANTAKSKFLATMSHELRTPLNSILGFSEIIRDERLGSLGDQRYSEYASYINESGSHLLSLIGDILDLSRIETGKMDLQFEPVYLRELAEAAVLRAATRERKANDCVTISTPTDLPQLSADRRSMLQMLINLISNALKFTPADGKITVSAFMRDDGGMTVQVRDTGIGMAPEDIPRALQAFTQVDDNLSRRHEGTGLGLTIVKSMMEQHGGQLDLQSAKGEGTTVSLVFPAARVLAAKPEMADGHAA